MLRSTMYVATPGSFFARRTASAAAPSSSRFPSSRRTTASASASRSPSRVFRRISAVRAEAIGGILPDATGELLVARLFPDEVAGAQVAQRLLDFRARVHHEGAVAGDRLVERLRGGEQEAASLVAGGDLDHLAVTEDH